MEISRFIVNIFEENTYIIWDKDTLEAAIVDPGMKRNHEEEKIDQFIQQHNLSVKMILLTHAHLDHTFGVAHVQDVYGAEVLANKEDEQLLAGVDSQARMFHLPYRLEPLKIDRYISHGDIITLGKEEIKVLYVPGHSRGSVAYYVPSAGFVLTGDVLFRMGIGRTDLPGGSQAVLLRSIREQLLTLPPDTIVYPGHGDATTIGAEAARF